MNSLIVRGAMLGLWLAVCQHTDWISISHTRAFNFQYKNAARAVVGLHGVRLN